MLAGTALAQALEEITIALQHDPRKWKPLPLLREPKRRPSAGRAPAKPSLHPEMLRQFQPLALVIRPDRVPIIGDPVCAGKQSIMLNALVLLVAGAAFALEVAWIVWDGGQ
jgi:hypothetical protein